MKKTGFGAGKYNGFGGKQNSKDRTIEHTGVRELYEESKVRADISDLEKMAVIDFIFPYALNLNQQVHIYFIRKVANEPHETKEMAPLWFKLDEIPYDKMWDSDKMWLPEILKGNKIKATFFWKEDNNTVDKFEYKIVNNI